MDSKNYNEYGLYGKIKMTINENNLIGDSTDLVMKIFPEWNRKLIKYKQFTEGITNKLILLYIGDDMETGVLFRVYGKNTDKIIDRKIERQNIQLLNSVGVSQPLYATFDNGIAYGFFNGIPLDEVNVKELDIIRCIVREMHRFHSVNFPGNNKDSYIWLKISMFIENTPKSFNDDKRTLRLREKIPPQELLYKEFHELKNKLSSLKTPIVFCHNDLLLKNLVYNKERNRVYIIDYEYGFYNYEAFDIANHFNEYAGVEEVDFNRYPDKEFQLMWLKIYYQEKSLFENTPMINDSEILQYYKIVNKFSLLSNFFWGVWALIQASYSTIDFDFLEYSILRLREYYRRKEEFLNM